MDGISLQAIILAALTVLGSIAGSAFLARAALRRVPSQNLKDDASAVSLYEAAAANRQKENDELRSTISDMAGRLRVVETRTNGPFRLEVEFTTGADLRITKATISTVPLSPTQGDPNV